MDEKSNKEAGPLPPPGSGSTSKGQSSVSTWLTSFVGEVRNTTRLPFRLQKWDDEQVPAEEIESDKSAKELTQLKALKEFGRIKLSELYSKVKTKTFNNMDGHTDGMKLSTPIDAKVLSVAVSHDKENQNSSLHDVSSHMCNSSSSGVHSNDDSHLDASSASVDDGFFLFSRKLNTANMGRTSSFLHDDSRKFLQPMAPPRKITLRDLRSFSTLDDNDEDDVPNLSFDDRSLSSTYLNDENVCMRTENNNINNLNRNRSHSTQHVSASLPNFMPISPVLKCAPHSKDANLCDNARRKSVLFRDSSLQSDSSHCSSVESLLESRKPDPEAILVNLGFGPIESEDILTRIPKRFLKPSQVRGIDTEAFLRRQQLASHLHDHSVLGYRGLLGNPDVPPSTIVAKIMERFEENERSRTIFDINMNRPQSAPPTPSSDNHI